MEVNLKHKRIQSIIVTHWFENMLTHVCSDDMTVVMMTMAAPIKFPLSRLVLFPPLFVDDGPQKGTEMTQDAFEKKGRAEIIFPDRSSAANHGMIKTEEAVMRQG